MAQVKFKIYTGDEPVVAGDKENINKPAYTEGQIIFAQQQG